MSRTLPTHDVILDLETGGLRGNDRPWEIGMVIDRPGQSEPELHHYYVADFDPSKADPMALQMNGFYDRHPLQRTTETGSRMSWDAAMALDDHGLNEGDPDGPPRKVHAAMAAETQLMWLIEPLLRNARVCIVNPTFDKPLLVSALRRARLAWTAYYTPLCIGSYAGGVLGIDPTEGRSDDVAAALGVKREDYGTGHTALVDSLYGRGILRAAEAKAGVAPGWKVRAAAEVA